MKKILELLQNKGGDIWSVTPDTSVLDAIKMMAEKGIGALMVLDGGKPVGIISERDYARKVILMGRSSENTPVSEIMSSSLIFADTEQSVEDCMALMTDHRIRHLPVLDNNELVGVISIGDLVKTIIDEQQFMIKQLETYIAS
ncbi:MAG: CBS domain-containing protein [Gammaproteobacteria bacterium]